MALGYYDDDGFWHYGEDDLADPGQGFSDLLNKSAEAIPGAVHSRVVTELATDSTIRDAAVSAVDTEIGDRDLVETNDPRLATLSEASPHLWAATDRARRPLLGVEADGVSFAALGIRTPYAGLDMPAGAPYLAGTYDRKRRRFYQDVIGADGRFTDATIASIASRIAAGAGAVKNLPHVLSLSAGTGIADTRTSLSARVPVKFAADVARFRVHVRNRNDRAGTANPGALAMAGLYWGAHARTALGELAGTWTAPPTQIAAPFNTSPAGAEWVSPWINASAAAGDDFLLGYGYTCAAQSNHAGIGGGWTTDSAADAGLVAPGGALTRVQQVPLDIWLECEVSASVPTVGWFGDSLTAGSVSTLPIYDSAARQHAFANGAWAIHYAHHGSSMAIWDAGDAYRWTKYGNPVCDAVVWALGSNDIFDGATLATTQARFVAVLGKVQAYIGRRIYLATIMPRNGAATDGPREAVRLAYNAWLYQRPGGALGVFDFAKSVESVVGTVRADYITADNVHLTTAGYAQNAHAVPASLIERN